jgi:molecular chaperone HscB
MNHSALERPNTNNYFQFYGLEEIFGIDLKVLKNHYLEKSKQYHPDYFGDDPQSQNIAVATSSFNNIAYKTLNSDIRRAQYLVELKLSGNEDGHTLPQAFLMEMMDLNEAVDDVQEDGKPALLASIGALKEQILTDIRTAAGNADWHETRIAVLKWKYLERLEARLA